MAGEETEETGKMDVGLQDGICDSGEMNGADTIWRKISILASRVSQMARLRVFTVGVSSRTQEGERKTKMKHGGYWGIKEQCTNKNT